MKFEDAGRAIDREVEKLSAYLDKKVKPASRRNMAKMLRRASLRLENLADMLEKKAS